jgi:hypothetical protein
MMEYDDNSSRWWTQKKQVHEGVWTVARRIEQEQAGRRTRLKKYQDLYEDAWHGDMDERVVSYNLVRSNIDTVCSKIAKNKPAVRVLTSGGDWGKRDKAEKLTKLIAGSFREMGAYQKGQLAFRDACIFDGGMLYVYRDPDAEHIKCERVYVDEILVDSLEGYYGEPRQIFRKRVMHRDRLAALYPKKRGWIMDAPQSKSDLLASSWGRDRGSLIDVVESWHLPSSDRSKDGRHVICLEKATLSDQPYLYDEFPFVKICWQEPVKGFWMPGLAQECWGLQGELNTHLENIRVAHNRTGHPVVWLHTAAKIDDDEINNEIGTIIRGEIPPQFMQTPTMAPTIYSWTKQLIEFGHEMPGVSQSAASGQKPSGVESGVAIREVNDIETERFVLAGQRYEQMYLDLARHVIRLAKEMYEDGVDYGVKVQDKNFLESISWSEVDLEDDHYELDMFPVSGLPQTPAGKIQSVIDLATNGLIEPRDARSLLGYPDIESAFEIEDAPRELINRTLDAMISESEYIPPEPAMDLEYAKKRSIEKINWCLLNNVPDEAVERIRGYLQQVEDLLAVAAPPPAPMPAAPPPMPAAEMPPPPDMSSVVAGMPEMGSAPLPM